MNRASLFRYLVVPALMLLAGCRTSFDREWKSAAVRPQNDPFAGRWEGQWRSAKHHNAGGRLRCVLAPVSPQLYRANFKANWMVFTSSYSIVFDAQRKKGELVFRGSENLGSLFGGVYTFSGRATPDRFTATYDSSYDRGTFEMGRPTQVLSREVSERR